jgi:hypothetical protein
MYQENAHYLFFRVFSKGEEMRYCLNQDVLRAWKEEEGRSYVWLSKRVGVKPDTLAQQIRGSCGLSLGVAMALEEATGIPIQRLVIKAS